MDRLKRTVLQKAVLATPIQDVAASSLQANAGAQSLPVHPHIGALGISNSALGNSPNAALPVCLTTLGDQALMNECGQVHLSTFCMMSSAAKAATCPLPGSLRIDA
jgi:hypothetical protein